MEESKILNNPSIQPQTSTKAKMEVEDSRIVCSNSHSLNKILDTAVKHVEQLADDRQLGKRKSEFINRFTEVFKNTLEGNLTINGLPWVVEKDTLSQSEKELQMNETREALLSKLSKTIEVTAHKRKNCTQECQRIYSMTLKHERQNLKKAYLQHRGEEFPDPVRFKPMDSSITEEVKGVCDDIISSNEKLKKQLTDLDKIQADILFANDVMKRQKPHLDILYDTGYNSE